MPRDFTDLGSRAAVDQTLSRMARDGLVRRVKRGVYDYPQTHAQFGALPPSVDAVASAVARRTGARLQVSGARAANALGVSDQVPSKAVYLTDGPSRKFHLGRRGIEFRNRSTATLAGAGTKSGLILQALRFLGPDAVTADVISQLCRSLSAKDRRALARHSASQPAWLRDVIERVIKCPVEA